MTLTPAQERTGLDDETKLACLRQIDKLDRVGTAGVFERLTEGVKDESGAFVEGVGLDRCQALEILCVIKPEIGSRIALMVALDADETADQAGKTAWDKLLEMRPNPDETWAEGGRPANIGWALDDLIKFTQAGQQWKDKT